MCVILVTFITTCLVTIAAVVVWRLHFTLILAFFLIFGALDGLFLTSALTKVPQGAWLTIVIAAVLCTILLIWRYGKNYQRKAEQSDLINPVKLIATKEDGTSWFRMDNSERPLKAIKGNASSHDSVPSLTKGTGMGIYFDKAGYLSPPVFTHFLRKFEAQHELSVFFNLQQVSRPTVGPVLACPVVP